MTNKKAINILKKQIDKLKTDNDRTKEWTFQTRTYIENFFGKESKEFLYINKFSFFNMYHDDVELFLNNCIELIENVGLKKNHKTNFLFTLPDWVVYLILPGLFSAGLAFGKYSSDLQNIELKRELQLLKDSISVPTNNMVEPEQ